MPRCASDRIAPVRFLRKVRGGSQSALIEASDGLEYVVKWQQSPQGCHIALNESFGTNLYREIGLPTPQWAAIEISDNFIDAHPDMWFRVGNRHLRPAAGLHFASLRLGTVTQTVYEVLPGSWFTRIQNRNSFLGALVADVWSEHVDCRQALFLQDEGHRFLSAVYIDHGHMFGGPDGSQKTRLRACMHLDLRVYDGLGVDDDLDYWISRIEDQGERIIANAAASIPEEWRSSRIEKNVDHLWTNLPKLRDLLMPAVFQFRAATAVAS